MLEDIQKALQGTKHRLFSDRCPIATKVLSAYHGLFTIDLGNASLAAGDLSLPEGILEGPYVRLRLTDTGAGMSEEVLEHMFEPFFTTKDAGKGSGLGLSTVYGIVRQNGGFIQCRSSAGKGTSFDIFFPRTEREADSPLAPAEPAGDAPADCRKAIRG